MARTAVQNARALHDGAPVALALSLTPFAALLQSIPSRPALARGSGPIDILFDPRTRFAPALGAVSHPRAFASKGGNAAPSNVNRRSGRDDQWRLSLKHGGPRQA